MAAAPRPIVPAHPEWSGRRCRLPKPCNFPALSFPGFSILRSAACQGRQGRHHEFVGRGRDTHLPAKIDDATAQPAEFKRLYGFQIVQHGGLHVAGQRNSELKSAELRVGQEVVRTCSSRWWQYNYK